MRRFPFILLLVLLCGTKNTLAAVALFACEPEWGALAEEIGGQQVSLFVATTAHQDPHRIEARPSLIAKLGKADLLFCSGADLEAGWLPMLLRRARNPDVQPGTNGYLMAADQVELLEIPDRLDRSDGDIHAQGNPHLHLDPHRLLKVARALATRLAQIDPEQAAYYRQRHADFQNRWQEAIARWQQNAASLRGKTVVVHHRTWSYLLNWLDMRTIAELEPKPGLPASVGHLSGLRDRLEQNSPMAIIRSPIDDPGPAQWLARRSGVPVLVLPHTVGALETTGNLFALFDDVLNQFLSIQP